jgi:hypothetical protein
MLDVIHINVHGIMYLKLWYAQSVECGAFHSARGRPPLCWVKLQHICEQLAEMWIVALYVCG